MSIRASITKQGNVTVISLQGKLDFESQDILRENIVSLMKEGRQVVIDLEELSFIGSSGVTQLFYSLAEYANSDDAPLRFCNVKSELRRIIGAYDLKKSFAIHTSREDALNGFFRSGKGENN
jgi:anti-anti-sigma factor